jgi:hypothetical protein
MQDTTKKCQKKRQFLCIFCPDSLMSWFQLYSHWFQIELDELYRFQYSPVPPDCPLFPKNAKNCKQMTKIWVFPAPIRLWTDSNSTLTDSRWSSTSSIEFTYSLDYRAGDIKKKMRLFGRLWQDQRNIISNESVIKGTSDQMSQWLKEHHGRCVRGQRNTVSDGSKEQHIRRVRGQGSIISDRSGVQETSHSLAYMKGHMK